MEASHSVAVSPDGSTVYITGNATGVTSDADCVTIAYNAATGARKWLARYHSPGNGGAAVVASPDGGTVFVTGSTSGIHGSAYLTIAYNATTGGRLWLARHTGPGNNPDEATAAALSPDGSTLYVTGQSWRAGWSSDYATVAYSG
jgi:DNA-binding beta-propeller fold protein YncE